MTSKAKINLDDICKSGSREERMKLVALMCAMSFLRDNGCFEMAEQMEPERSEHTCTVEHMHGYTDAFCHTSYVVELSCHTLDAWEDPTPPRFCPYCGAKVVSE